LEPAFLAIDCRVLAFLFLTPIRIFECRASRLYHRQWMVIRDSFLRLILSDFLDRGQWSPTFWVQARSYTTGELSIYGTNGSRAPFDAR